jgi:hypothetical protein
MMRQARLGLRDLVWILASLPILSGCATQVDPQVTFSQPKIYTDEYLIRILSERRNNLREINKTIKASELQEMLGVRQAVQRDTQISVQPSTGGPVNAPPPTSGGTVTLPERPAAPPEVLGRRHADILRDHITRDHDLTAWEALHDLDVEALKKNKRLALIRVDVSINNYPRSSSNEPHFVRTDFKLECKSQPPAERQDTACDVYYLSPEASSVVAQESLASSFLENYAGQIGGPVKGVDVAAAGRFQRQLEETLLSIVEQPIQYAIYKTDKNQFAFAFGPRRRIQRRGALNPQRWIGHTYRFDYEIGPSPRDVYALVLMPCETTDLTLYATSSPTVLDQDEVGRQAQVGSMLIGKTTIQESCAPSGPSIHPTEIYPKLVNTIYLTSTEPILPRSEVLIGPERVPDEDIVRIDRYRLRITLKPSNALQDMLKIKSNPKITVVRPGHDVIQIAPSLKLLDSDPPKVEK